MIVIGDMVIVNDPEKEARIKQDLVAIQRTLTTVGDLTPLYLELGEGLIQLAASIVSTGTEAYRNAAKEALQTVVKEAFIKPEKHDLPESLYDQLEPAMVIDAKTKARQRSWEDLAEKRRMMRQRRGKHV